MKTASQIARYLLGLILLVFGLNGFFNFLHMPGPTGVAAQFLGAVYVSRFYMVIFVLQIVSALLLLANRYVPLALTILGPIGFNIVCIHIFMIRAGLSLAIVVTVLWLLVAYSVRSAFSGIFQCVPDAKHRAASFSQYGVKRTLEVERESTKAKITKESKEMETLEDDPGSTSAQKTDSR